MTGLVCVAASVWCAVATQSPPQFRLLGGLADQPGAATVATAVSGDGSVVVGTSSYSSGAGAGFRWTVAGGMMSLGPLVGYGGETFLQPVAASSDGSVVVGSEPRSRSAWRWTFGTNAVRLVLMPSAYESFAHGMNRNARFVVGRCNTDSPPTGAYVYDALTGATIALSQVGSGGQSADAYSVSLDGSIVIGSSTVWNLTSSTRTFVSAPIGSTGGGAVAASDDGAVWVGHCSTANGMRAARWVSATGVVLPVPPMGIWAQAVCTDAGGATVGGWYRKQLPSLMNDPPWEQRAMAWRADLGAVDLTDYATATLGLNLGGVVLYTCNGLSADGLVLVGEGRTSQNLPVAWMLRLPGALPLCAADLGRSGGMAGPDGALDNNDFIVFIAAFFAGNARADLGSAGGATAPDGALNNNDFIAFINEFFNGCS
jgi:probable HAF family extracellular repeat protein